MKNLSKKFISNIDRLVSYVFTPKPALGLSGPIFIIGPPRSGTTLVYQLLTSCFDVSYITNLEARRTYAPALAAVLAKIVSLGVHEKTQFYSAYGRTPGQLGPHEAGQFWYRWFPAGENVYVRYGDLNSKTTAEMKRYVSFLQRIKQKPIVFKNVYHCARIDVLKKLFPDAVFIVIRREPLEVAQSILRAREDVGVGRETWWSLPLPPPVGIPVEMPWAEQIVRQVEDVYGEIDSQREGAENERFFNINYRSLCEVPEEVLFSLESYLHRRGIRVRRLDKPPEFFEPGPEVSVSHEDYTALKEALVHTQSQGEKA